MGFHPSRPTPRKIFCRQGSTEGFLNISEIQWHSTIPTGVATAAGHEPRERE